MTQGSRDPSGLRVQPQHGSLIGWIALALLAFVPTLRSSPGRMPADSKLYLYLDPGRFLSQAATTFDPTQYGGWVPHQHIAYLWPSGPYYWSMNAVGVPDWVAQRVWVGSVLLAAGSGTWWCVRRLGFGRWPAFTAAVVFQLSVYTLPYVSRTSVMLLPWAGLGWIVGLTVQASLVPASAGRRQHWRAPALIALVVATVGGVNATALVLIAPAPALWLIHAGLSGLTPWRQVAGVALRTASLCVSVSMWWITMLWIQGRFGARVLPYSETLADVSFTSTGAEVWRGLGYWLFYIRDIAGPTTSSSFPYLMSGMAIAVSYAIPIVGLLGVTTLRWRHRRFAILLIAVGALLAVGVHPVEHPAPWTWPLTRGPFTGLALALRSSTRALPVMMLGLALGCAAGVEAAGRVAVPTRDRALTVLRPVVALTICAIALINVPSIRHAQLVDPELTRDEQPPPSWLAAATTLDETDPELGRVLQVPGIEFGDYRWGVTIDQPVAGLTAKPLITRDLLPLGSAGMMDVLYAFDDRIQAGVLENESIEPVVHSLGADQIWLTGDLAYDRYRVARPIDIAQTVISAGSATTFGEPVINTPAVPQIDERTLTQPNTAIAPVTLVQPDAPGAIVRVDTDLVAVSGSGDAVVDSRLVHRALRRAGVVYTADRSTAPLDGVSALIITDSNRNRNRHWRGSLDGTGETLGPDDPVDREQLDQRLPVFARPGADRQTVALQSGPLHARSDSYGEPFGYQPEHRAFMAVDGDAQTAWTVGEHGEARGAVIELTTTADVDALTLHQYLPIVGQRRISKLTLSAVRPDGTRDDRSIEVAEPTVAVDVDAPSGTVISLRIDDVMGGQADTEGIVADVGFAEITASVDGRALGPSTEWIRPPIDANEALRDRPDLPVGVSLRRERVSALNPWRSDPEPTMQRVLELGTDHRFTVAPTVRLDANAADRAIADVAGLEAWATSRVQGSPRNGGFAAVDGDPTTSWISAFDEGRGAALTFPTSPDDVEVVVESLTIRQPNPDLSQITTLTISANGQEWTRKLPRSTDGTTTVRIDPPVLASTLTLTAETIDPKWVIDRRFGDRRELPVSISEILVNGRSPGVELTPSSTGCAPLVNIDGTVLTGQISIDADVLAGAPAIVDMCQTTVDFSAGEHFVTGATPNGFTLDNLDLTTQGFDARFPAGTSTEPDDGARRSSARVESVSGSSRDRSIELSGCVDGCWLAFGEGYNPGWSATAGGASLGSQILIDGTSNGWWVPPSATDDGSVTVRVSWGQQRPLNLAFAVTLVAAVAAIGLASVRNRAPRSVAPIAVDTVGFGARVGRTGATRYALTALFATLLIAGVRPLPITVVVAGLVAVTGRTLWARLAPVLLVSIVAIGVIVRMRAHRFLPDGAWPSHFDTYHPIAMAAVALLLASLVLQSPTSGVSDDRSPSGDEPGDEPGADEPGNDASGTGDHSADEWRRPAIVPTEAGA